MRVITVARTNKFSPCVSSAAYTLMTYRRQQILPGHGVQIESHLVCSLHGSSALIRCQPHATCRCHCHQIHSHLHTHHLIDWLHPRRDETSRTLVRNRRHVRILSPGPANKRLILRPRSRSSGPPFGKISTLKQPYSSRLTDYSLPGPEAAPGLGHPLAFSFRH